MSRTRAHSWAVGFTLALLWAGSNAAGACAQAPSDDDVAMARELFQSGIEAAEQQRWNEAQIEFERSYVLAPRPSTLFNLANAQAELGDVVGAATSYRLFLGEVTAGPEATYRPDAEAALAEIEPRIAEVTIALSVRMEGDTLEVDGNPAPIDAVIPMNPGAHHLVVRRGTEVVGELDLTLVEGEQRGLTLPVRASVALVQVLPRTIEEEDDLAASPWLWLGIGAGVAVVAAVVIGIVFASSGTEATYEGNFGPGSVTFE